ncbi:hypothetical protein DPMN_009721 [Dreissena polymorpha]|uniref:Uncharacterized protein n=1 Tax=Dreissena polymorpha TaxID=45954 RepID=A0A9D4MYK9_DREPO|nr:hypothetical protein DPMN_009721 [Dreissena polymorpha]
MKGQEHTGRRQHGEVKHHGEQHDAPNTSTDITMNGEKVEEETSFKYLDATLSNDGTSTAEVRISIAMGTASMA